MKIAFFAGLLLSAVLIWSSSVTVDDSTSRVNLPLLLLTMGITLALCVMGIAVWFAPVLVAARHLRKNDRESLILVCQKTPELKDVLKNLKVVLSPYNQLPTYLILKISSTHLEIWRPLGEVCIAKIPMASISGIAIDSVNIPKLVPAIVFQVTTSSRTESIRCVPCRRGSEIFPMSFPEAQALVSHDLSARLGQIN